jgi:hypothetical protein
MKNCRSVQPILPAIRFAVDCMGNSIRHVAINRRDLPQASIPWICPWLLQQNSGLREPFNQHSKSCIGGVVWNVHQSASLKCFWMPDAVDVLNVVLVKDTVRRRLDILLLFLKDAYENSISAFGAPNHASKRTSITDESMKHSSVISQASLSHLAAVSHHYDQFSCQIVSMYVLF